MQTTLRIEDRIFREAKTEAVREGITLTRFIEDALRLRLERARHEEKRTSIPLPSYTSGARIPEIFDLVSAIRAAEASGDAARTARLFKKRTGR